MAGVIPPPDRDIPGPNSRALMARRSKAVPKEVSGCHPIAIVHAEGAIPEQW